MICVGFWGFRVLQLASSLLFQLVWRRKKKEEEKVQLYNNLFVGRPTTVEREWLWIENNHHQQFDKQHVVKSLQPNNNNVKIQVEETPSKNQRTGFLPPFLPPFLPSFLSSFLPLGTKTVTGLQIGHDTLLYFCLQRFFYNPIPVLSIQGWEREREREREKELEREREILTTNLVFPLGREPCCLVVGKVHQTLQKWALTCFASDYHYYYYYYYYYT